MRMLVFFDLPTVKAIDRRNYNRFRKFLIKEGFIMVQESVYCKLVLNHSIMNSVKKRVEKNAPQKGLVQLLCVTEKQYASIEYITGSKINKKVIDSMERLIVIWL